jgi:PAS domain S-box-containing protein
MERYPLSQAPSRADSEATSHNELARLIRVVMWMLVMFAAAFAATSWQALADLPWLRPLLFVVVAFACAISASVHRRTKRAAEARGHVTSAEGNLVKTLATSRDVFMSVVDSLDACVLTVNLDGTVLAANKAVVDLVKAPFDQIVSSPLTGLMSQPSAQEMQEGLTRFREKRHWSGVIKVFVNARQRWYFFDCTFYPVIKDELLEAITVVANDITAQRERELLFANLFETLHEPVWIAECDGTLIEANSALGRTLGTSTKSLVRTNLLERVLGEAREVLVGAFVAREGVRDFEVTLVGDDGNKAICLMNATPITDVKGATRYHGTLTDITRRRQMERKLREEQVLREQIVASLPDPLVTFTPEGKLTFLSTRAEMKFGPNQSPGKSFLDILDPQDEINFYTLLNDIATDSSTVCTRELRLRTIDDGGWRPFMVRAAALKDSEGVVRGGVSSLRDISDERRLQEQLIATERLAAVGQMIEGFAHELNNPLTAVIGACELLNDSDLPSSAEGNLQLLETQTRRARDIVQNLVTFSKRTPDVRVSVSLSEVIDRTVALRAHSLRKNKVEVRVHTSEESVCTIGDPGQLMQMLLNILVNAEQACCNSPRAEHRTVNISCGSRANEVYCTITDSGSGIPQSQLSRVFEPFFSIKRPGGGSGLGLTVSKSIAEAHAGRISVEATEDWGTIVTVVLPRTSAQTA